MVSHNPGSNEVVSTLNRQSIRRSDMWCFQSEKPISTKIISYFMTLFQIRDDGLCSANADYSSNTRGYIERRKSFFADPIIIGQLFSACGTSIKNEVKDYLRSLNANQMHRLYILIYLESGTKVELIVIGAQAGKVYYLNPTADAELHDRVMSFSYTFGMPHF